MNGMVRRLASGMLSAASVLLPPGLASWSRAMRRELVEMADDWVALRFAAGCLRAALGLAAAAQLRTAFERLRGLPHPIATSTERPLTMNTLWMRPRLLGLGCGGGAVTLGLAYMVAAEAPWRYVLVNLTALIIGGAGWFVLGRLGGRGSGSGHTVLTLALLLIVTAMFGATAEGASRWLTLGPLSLQVSLVVLPAMMLLYARDPEPVGTFGMMAAALALALQPDRAMAGVLSAGLLAVVLTARSGITVAAMVAAVASFGWTLLQPDALPAVPYVDQILFTAFDVHVLAGAAVMVGAAALTLPAVAGLTGQAGDRPVLLTFGLCWSAIVAAAALGNYPTPLVGYGASAVIGYLLSVALLPARAGKAARRAALRALAAPRDSSRSDTSELRAARFVRRWLGVATAQRVAGSGGETGSAVPV